MIKVIIYLTVNYFKKSMNDYAEVNEAYAKYFETNPPVRTCIAV